MAVKWLRLLKEQFPSLGERAEKLNERDGFTMYSSSDKEKKKKRKKDRSSESDTSKKKVMKMN
jgi:hypothetical protein